MEDRYNGKVACVLHDFCYGTSGTTREDCDNEFKENLTKVCSVKDPLIDTSCHIAIEDAYLIVRTFGESHYEPFENCDKNCLCRSGGKNLSKRYLKKLEWICTEGWQQIT